MKLRQEILKVLEKNARTEMKELSVLLDTPEDDIRSEVSAMEEEGVICGYHTIINRDALGDDKVSALIEVRVTPQRGMGFDSIAERIYKFPEVDSVYLMSGAYDLMVICSFRTMQEVGQFVSMKLSTLESVLSTATHFIMKRYKDHGSVLAKRYEDTRELITP